MHPHTAVPVLRSALPPGDHVLAASFTPPRANVTSAHPAAGLTAFRPVLFTRRDGGAHL
ncbi:MAG: hypothetical protein R2706_06075 [Acidimicrobiales bacterium]